MSKKFYSLLLVLVLIAGSLFAAVQESWINNSITYEWALNSEVPLTSGSLDTLGYDFSWFGFPGGSSVGIATHLGLSFSLDAVPIFNRMYVFMGPAFSTVLSGGVLGYVATGPSYTITTQDSGAGSVEQQLGVGVDVGARFMLAGSVRWDLGLIAGVLGDISLLRLIDAVRKEGFSANARAYFGFSFGSAMAFPRYGLFSPVVYHY